MTKPNQSIKQSKDEFRAIGDDYYSHILALDVSLPATKIAFCIVQHYDRTKHECVLSMRKIAKLCNISLKSVDRGIRQLEQVKFIWIDKMNGIGKHGGDVNKYHLNVVILDSGIFLKHSSQKVYTLPQSIDTEEDIAKCSQKDYDNNKSVVRKSTSPIERNTKSDVTRLAPERSSLEREIDHDLEEHDDIWYDTHYDNNGDYIGHDQDHDIDIDHTEDADFVESTPLALGQGGETMLGESHDSLHLSTEDNEGEINLSSSSPNPLPAITEIFKTNTQDKTNAREKDSPQLPFPPLIGKNPYISTPDDLLPDMYDRFAATIETNGLSSSRIDFLKSRLSLISSVMNDRGIEYNPPIIDEEGIDINKDSESIVSVSDISYIAN